jgi:hypothetical protein
LLRDKSWLRIYAFAYSFISRENNMKTHPAAAAAEAEEEATEAFGEEEESAPFDPESLDPLDARRVSLDIFELYSYEAIMTEDVGRRAFLIGKMRVSPRVLVFSCFDLSCPVFVFDR